MSIEDTKKELAASGWKTKPEDNLPVTKEELMARIKETARAMDTNFKNRVDHAGTTPSRAIIKARKKKTTLPKGALALLLMGLEGPLGHPADAFKAYDYMK
jgi:hypothetical protein